MLKKILLMLFLYVSHINSMDHALCYLECLPIDVQDHIFFWVTRYHESETECFDRTKKLEKIPLDIYQDFCPKACLHSIQEFAVYNPHKTKIAVYQTLGRVSRRQDLPLYQPRLIVIDLQKSRDTNIIYDQKVDTWNYEAIAVSPYGTMIAAVYENERDQESKNKFLMVKNLITQEERKFPIAKNAAIVSMDFNKQGTSVSVHSQTIHIAYSPDGVYLGKYHKNKYSTFPLKIMKPDDQKGDTTKIEELHMDDKKITTRLLLRKYFMEKLICKSLKNILD